MVKSDEENFDLKDEIPESKEEEKEDPNKEYQAKLEAADKTIADLKAQVDGLSGKVDELTPRGKKAQEDEIMSEFDKYVKDNKMDPNKAKPFRDAVLSVFKDAAKEHLPGIQSKLDSTNAEVMKTKISKEIDDAKSDLRQFEEYDEFPAEVLDAMIAAAINDKKEDVIDNLQRRPGGYYREQYDMGYMRYKRDPHFRKKVDEFKETMAKEAEKAKQQAGNRSGSGSQFTKRHPDVAKEKDSVEEARAGLFQYM